MGVKRYRRVRPQLVVLVAALALVLMVSTGPAAASTRQDLRPSLPPALKVTTFAPIQPLAPLYTRTDCTAVDCVALTFDDGPDPTYTPQVLDILQQKQVSATFFMIGYRVAAYPSIVKHAYDTGQEVENHSWSHVDLSKLPPDQIMNQIKQTNDAIVAAGVPAPTMLRPPYGAVNDTVRAANPLATILWNIDPLDWKLTNIGKVVANVVDPAKAGDIVLMHSVHPQDPQALPSIIDGLRAKGLTIVPVSDLLSLQSGDRAQYSHQ